MGRKILFKIAEESLKNKILRNKLTVFIDNFKMQMRNTKQDPNKWKDIPYSYIGMISIMSIISL